MAFLTAGNNPGGAWVQAVNIAFRFLFVALAVVAAGWAVSNIRQVPPESRVVVLRFGKVVRQQDAGLLIAWPRPIEQVVTLPSSDQQIEFPIYRLDGAGRLELGTAAAPTRETVLGDRTLQEYALSADPRNNTGFVLTGDLSVVHLQATLFYRISDPISYLIAADHVGPALTRLFVASAVSVCAGRDLDTILVARPEATMSGDGVGPARERLRADLVNAVNQRLAELAKQGIGLGIKVNRVDLVPAIPSGAKSAFDRVLFETQTAEKRVAEARTEAERITQDANRQADRLHAEAVARAEEEVAEAKTRTAVITTLVQQPSNLSRQMLVKRLYYSRVGALLRKAGEVDAFDRNSGNRVIFQGPPDK